MPWLHHTWREWWTSLVGLCGGALTVARSSSLRVTCQGTLKHSTSHTLACSVKSVRRFSKLERAWEVIWIMSIRTPLPWNTTFETSYNLFVQWNSACITVNVFNVHGIALQLGVQTMGRLIRKSRLWSGGFPRAHLSVTSVATATTPSRTWRNTLKLILKHLAIHVPFVRNTSRLGTVWIPMSAHTTGRSGRTNLTTTWPAGLVPLQPPRPTAKNKCVQKKNQFNFCFWCKKSWK